VKLAVDLQTYKRVAIKFLRVSNKTISKHKALECLIKEIKILSDCDHPNVARILEASLNGFLVKEYPAGSHKDGTA
jgi:serine/threonine protein kinase